MPKLGEIKHGRDIGRVATATTSFIWIGCADCGKESWKVYHVRRKFWNPRCCSCANTRANKPRLKKGCYDKQGYIMVPISKNSFFWDMALKRGYILQHRLVMAQHLGRCLTQDELVHHLNRVKDDNRLENLVLTSRSEHLHLVEPYRQRIVDLEMKVKDLTTRMRRQELIRNYVKINSA